MAPIFAQFLINVAWPAQHYEQLAFAHARGFGVEIEDFRDPAVFADRATLDRLIAWYQEQLPQVPGIVSLHARYDGVFPGAEGERGPVSRDRIATCLDIAGQLGASRTVFHVAVEQVPLDDRAGWLARQAACWREVLAGRRVEVMLENEWETPPELLRDAVDAVNLPTVGACFDIGHAHLYGYEPATRWVEVLGPRLRHLHLHDNAARHREDDQHLLPGYGRIDWGGFASALRAQGLCPPAVIELGSVDPATIDTQFLERLNGAPVGAAEREGS